MQAESERGWTALAKDVEAAIARGESPVGNTGLELAERGRALLALFTGGDPGIEQKLKNLFADKAHWPASFKKPFSDAVDNFFCQAADALAKTKS